MRRRPALPAAAAIVGIAAVLVLASLREGPPGNGEARRRGARSESAGDPGESLPAPEDGPVADPPGDPAADRDPLDALAAALEETGAPAAAARLRRWLRTDPTARARAAERLLDPATPHDLRVALALVFGTLPGDDVDPLLVELLRASADDPSLSRSALLALGATREPEEDDDIFDLDDRPWGATGPGGIGITVRRDIADETTRLAILGALGRPEPALREAAATSLRHSLAAEDARTGFLAALAREDTDAVAAVLAEALVERAARVDDPAFRRIVGTDVIARAGESAFDAYRFLLENDLPRVPLDAAARARLRELAGPGHPPGTRTFALNVLAGGARTSGPAAIEEARETLRSVLVEDAEDAARDCAARCLRRVPASPATNAALAGALRGDAAWNVRYTALETIAHILPAADALPLVRLAERDSDERVAQRARELAVRLTRER